MYEYKLTVHPFRMGNEKDAANKILEEASEAREAAQRVRTCRADVGSAYGDFRRIDDMNLTFLADELADVVQAACNLAARYNIDMDAAMQRCEKRNRDRGRYGMSEGAKAIYDRMMEGASE